MPRRGREGFGGDFEREQMLIVGPVNLKMIEEAGVIRAFMTDGSYQVEISTLSLHAAERSEETFEEWQDLCKNIINRFIKQTSGHDVVRMDESKPHESN